MINFNNKNFIINIINYKEINDEWINFNNKINFKSDFSYILTASTSISSNQLSNYFLLKTDKLFFIHQIHKITLITLWKMLTRYRKKKIYLLREKNTNKNHYFLRHKYNGYLKSTNTLKIFYSLLMNDFPNFISYEIHYHFSHFS